MEGGCQEADGRFWGVFGDLQPDISGQSGRDLAEGLGGMGALGDDETPRRRNAVGLEIAGPLLWLSPAEIMVWATIVAMPAPLRMRRAREEQRCDRADAM